MFDRVSYNQDNAGKVVFGYSKANQVNDFFSAVGNAANSLEQSDLSEGQKVCVCLVAIPVILVIGGVFLAAVANSSGCWEVCAYAQNGFGACKCMF